jgi:hypothetical protein
MAGYRDDREGLRQALDESRKEAERLRKRVEELEAEEAEDEKEDEPSPPSAPLSKKNPGTSILIGFGTLLLFLLGPILGMVVCVSLSPKKPKGSIESTGGELGKWTMSIDKCQSGDHTNYHGVDLYSHSNAKLGVRALVDPSQGKLLNVNIPASDGRAVQFKAEACSKFQIDLTRTNTEVNDIRLYEGSIDFDCTHSAGKERVFGKVTFENCQ